MACAEHTNRSTRVITSLLMKRLRETTLYEYKGFGDPPRKKKQWRERSLWDVGVQWKRTYSPVELLPHDVLRLIASFLPLTSRVSLQRVSVSLHKAIPGLFLPAILEPWRHVLSIQQPVHLHHFLRAVLYAGILCAPRRLLRVLDLAKDQWKRTDAELFTHNRASGTQTFCLALEYEGSEREKRISPRYSHELIIASDSRVAALCLKKGHVWRPDMNQWARTTCHVWGPPPYSDSLRWESRAFHTLFNSYSGAEGWLLQEVLMECSFFDGKEDEDSDMESYDMEDETVREEIF